MYYLESDYTTATHNARGGGHAVENLPSVGGGWYKVVASADGTAKFVPDEKGTYIANFVGLYNSDGCVVQKYVLSKHINCGSVEYKIFNAQHDADKFNSRRSCQWQREFNDR